jgi:hypothetical protein
LNNRFQASGYRHQGSGDETICERVEARSNGEAQPLYPVVPEAPTAVANGPEYLKPETCSLKPPAKADA